LSISIYYTAKRRAKLTPSEQDAVAYITGRYAVDSQIEALIATGSGLNWESFNYSVNAEPGGLFKKGIVFSGSTKLPNNNEDADWIGIQYWSKCLSEIRLALSGCDWDVAVEDHQLRWNGKAGEYDLSQ